jgi:hypothetical protein
MEIVALNCPNPADIGAQPAYDATLPTQEFRGKVAAERAPTTPGSARKAGRGRRRKYTVEHLAKCLGGERLSTSELRAAATKRCGMSRAMFYRLLEIGRNESRLQQCGGTSKLWEAV